MDLKSDNYSVSGPDGLDCFFLANRYEEKSGYVPLDSECWVLSLHPQAADGQVMLNIHLGSATWLTALWRGPGKSVYVSDASGFVHVNPDLVGPDHMTTWQRHPLDASLHGIWGLDDSFVLTWGGRGKTDFPVFRWDGARWTETANPGFRVEAMHGLAPDLVYAVGSDGMIARWDGGSWQSIGGQTTEHLTTVFVAGPDEMYAAGNGGSVLEGSSAGWARLGDLPGDPMPIQCVAKWNGHLWVGTFPAGLHRRIGLTNQFELVKPNIQPSHMDARGALVMSCPTLIAATSDGVTYRGTPGALLARRAGIPLLEF